jgi:nitrite reductase/ring-hydroxylating ferredoxin subunit
MILFFIFVLLADEYVKQNEFTSSVGTLKVCIHKKFLTSHIFTMPAISAVIICGVYGKHFTPTNG